MVAAVGADELRGDGVARIRTMAAAV